MNKSLIFFSFLLFLSFQLAAQKDFRDGFIITLDKDTLTGKIEFRSNEKNKISCAFRNDTAVIEYLPAEILGFGYFQDKFYSSRVIDSLFIEVLVQGELSLYKVDKQNFIIRKAGPSGRYSEKDQRIDTVQNQLLFVSNKVKWKGILSVFAFDCISNPRLVQDLEPDEKSLAIFVIEYNKCKGSAYHEYKNSKPWSKLEYGITAGFVRTGINFNPAENVFPYLKDSYKSSDPAFGLLFNFSSPRLTEKFSLQVEIQYLKSRFFSDIVKQVGNTTEYYNTVMNFTSIMTPLSVKYSFYNRQYSLFLNVGANITYNIKSESVLITETESNYVVNTSERGVFLINNTQVGYWAGLGISKSFGSFDMGGTIRYYRSSQYYNIEKFTVSINRFSLTLLLTKR